MRKAAQLVIFEGIQFSEPIAVDTTKQNSEVMPKLVCLVHQEAF